MRSMTFRTFWINTALSVAAVAVFLGALEIGARILGARPIYGGSASIFVEDRELLWRLRRNCNVVWRGHRAGINSMGLRSPEIDYAASPHPKILVIGDSITYGDGVATDETYPRRLEKRIDDATVINAGIPGYGTIQSFGLLERIGDHLAPDLVIYGYCLNDCHDDLILMRHHRAKYVEKRLLKVLPATAPAVLFRSAFWSWLHDRLYSTQADGSPRGSLGPWGRVRHAEGRVPRLRDVWAPQKRNPQAREAWELVRKSFTAFKRWAESHQARFAVVCFPFVVQFNHLDHELEITCREAVSSYRCDPVADSSAATAARLISPLHGAPDSIP